MGNQGGNAGNQGRNAWNQVGNLGNQGGNVGNQGGNAGNQGGDVGNAGNQYKGNIKLMKCHHPADISISPPKLRDFSRYNSQDTPLTPRGGRMIGGGG